MSLCELMRRLGDMGSRKKKLNFPSSEPDFAGVVRSTRDEKPLHYILKIQSFSVSKFGRYESKSFDVGGYQWKLALYPNGDKKRDGSHHISLYLVSVDDNVLGANSEVNVMFTFLVYDKLRDKYLSVQDGKVRRFHALKTEWGFPKLLTVNTFNDASNGFLVDDCCAFGVDIFFIKCDAKWESLSMIKEPSNNIFTWKINNFSQLDKTFYDYSFEVGGYSCKINLYPKGKRGSQAKTEFLSLYLMVFNSSKPLPKGSRVYMDCEMTILNQLGVGGNRQGCGKHWFEFNEGWGWSNFISLSDLKEPARGFIHKDTMIVELKVKVVSNLESFV